MQRRAAFIGLLTVVALLSGCGGEDEKPATLPSVSEEPETSQASAPTASPTPTSAASTQAGISAEEAVALARKYYETITLIAHEGQGLERFDALVHSSCMPCQEQAQRIREVLAGGNHVVGGDLIIVDTRVDSVAGNTAHIKVGTKSLEGKVIDESGEVIDTLPADPVTDQVLTVALTPDGVRIVDLLALGAR
jgi:hypothetical protein